MIIKDRFTFPPPPPKKKQTYYLMFTLNALSEPMILSCHFAGPFVTYLYQRLHGGSRWVLVMTGAVLAPLALIAGSFVTNAAQLAVCLSVAGMHRNIIFIRLFIYLFIYSSIYPRTFSIHSFIIYLHCLYLFIHLILT